MRVLGLMVLLALMGCQSQPPLDTARTGTQRYGGHFPKRFGPICAGSLALLLPPHVVAAEAGLSARDGTAPVDLGVESGA
jgi:hypothetical protein